jgi:hypothetical protein
MRYLSILAALLTISCATTPSPSATTTLEWQFKGTTDYEAKTPGAGVGKRYESEAGWIDVYLFGADRDNWLEGTSDPGFASQFAEAAQGIVQAEKSGHYRNVRIEAPTDIVIAGRTFRHFRAQYDRKEAAVESHTFMTAIGGRLLKYRMSFPSPAPKDLGFIITNFIEQTAKGYENP